ncbi:MAG TPA: twin-arginine translocase subunit TatC [Blastocatellia bacterium]|nr:twin-arginine translocase subunit TatC [Blastocatellia bacterium]
MSSEHKEQQEGLQMSFLDHLDELRRRLVHSAIAIAIAFGICFAVSDYIFKFLSVPVVKQLQKSKRDRQAKYGQPNLDDLKDGQTALYTFVQDTSVNGVKVPNGATVRVKRITKDNQPQLALELPWAIGRAIVPAETPVSSILKEGEKNVYFDDENSKLVLRGVTSSFMIYMTVALYAGIAFAIPFLLYQIWAFIAPGLYKHERRYVTPLIVMGTVFFILGAAFAYKIAFPTACDYLLGLAVEGGFQTLYDAEDYLNLIIMIMLGLGIVFQIPTLSYLLARIGLLTPRMMWKSWRYAVVIIMIIAAVLTPTADAINMTIFAAPMLILYFLSIGIVWFFGKQRRREKEVTALATTK